MRLQPARCRRHFVEPILLVQRPVGEPGIPRCPAFDLMPLSQMRAHSRFHMKLETIERLAAIAIMKVPDPAPEGGIDIFHYHSKRLRRHPPVCKSGNAVFDLLQGFS